MKIIDVIPLETVDNIPFGADREKVRKHFGRGYKSLKKNTNDSSTTDIYKDFHIYYSDDNKLVAIEFFGNLNVRINGEILFPGKTTKNISLVRGMQRDGFCFLSKEMSIGITIEPDDDKIDAILVGCKNYYL